MIDHVPRCYGYARASDRYAQILSPERQEAQIQERAGQIQQQTGAELARIRVDKVSGSKVRYNKRQEFRKLMQELQKGDHLIIWRLDRLDRGWTGLIQCLGWLVERGVEVHVLEHGDMQLDLKTANGRLFVSIMAGFAAFESERLSESVKAARRYCLANGLSVGGWPGFGRKWVAMSGPKKKGRTRKAVVWDEAECRQIREIYERSTTGQESIRQIGVDFLERDERKANGKPWVRVNRKGYVDCGRIYRVLKWYDRLLANGLDLGCDVNVDPQGVIPD
jgi:DNA invertase Pin-like site-specific DNA recombinase